MKLLPYKNNRSKVYLAAPLVLTIVNILSGSRAFAQIDYAYGRNLKGIRLSAGVGFAYLQTHFSQNPTIANFVGNLDYDFSPYFSIGGEGQAGNLQGIDSKQHLPYSSSTNKYLSVSINAKAALGLIYDSQTESVLQNAIKRLYIGAGIGAFKNDITLTAPYDPNIKAYATFTKDKCLVFPFSFGTNIDLLGLTKKDILTLNPEYQFDVIHSPYADGYISTANSKTTVGYYTMLSLKLRYKF
jgi:hypothetical protein